MFTKNLQKKEKTTDGFKNPPAVFSRIVLYDLVEYQSEQYVVFIFFTTTL